LKAPPIFNDNRFVFLTPRRSSIPSWHRPHPYSYDAPAWIGIDWEWEGALTLTSSSDNNPLTIFPLWWWWWWCLLRIITVWKRVSYNLFCPRILRKTHKLSKNGRSNEHKNSPILTGEQPCLPPTHIEIHELNTRLTLHEFLLTSYLQPQTKLPMIPIDIYDYL
jgi:hypothetical protein